MEVFSMLNIKSIVPSFLIPTTLLEMAFSLFLFHLFSHFWVEKSHIFLSEYFKLSLQMGFLPPQYICIHIWKWKSSSQSCPDCCLSQYHSPVGILRQEYRVVCLLLQGLPNRWSWSLTCSGFFWLWAMGLAFTYVKAVQFVTVVRCRVPCNYALVKNKLKVKYYLSCYSWQHWHFKIYFWTLIFMFVHSIYFTMSIFLKNGFVLPISVIFSL